MRHQVQAKASRTCRKCRIKKARDQFPGIDIKFRTCNECWIGDREQRAEQALAEINRDHRKRRYYVVASGLDVRKSTEEVRSGYLRQRAERQARTKAYKVYRQALRTAHEIYMRTDPEVLARRNELERNKYQSNPEANKRKAKSRYYNNLESERLRVTLYKHSHPDKVAKWGDKRKALAALYADGSLTHDEAGKMFAGAKRCPYCERQLTQQNKTLDHIVALSNGGTHGIHNALICCRTCNIRKKNMSFAEWCSTLSESCERRARKIYRQRYKAEPEQQVMILQYA